MANVQGNTERVRYLSRFLPRPRFRTYGQGLDTEGHVPNGHLANRSTTSYAHLGDARELETIALDLTCAECERSSRAGETWRMLPSDEHGQLERVDQAQLRQVFRCGQLR